MPLVEQAWNANMHGYGADKVWQQINREGIEIAGCTFVRPVRGGWACEMSGAS